MQTNEKAFQAAGRLLSARVYSEAGLKKKLAAMGFLPEQCAEAVSRLKSLGLLDDSAYAATLSRHYTEKGFGPARIRQELFRRGIAPELIEKQLDDLEEGDGVIERLLAARLKEADRGDRKAFDRAVRYVLRRGYAWEQVAPVLRRFTDETIIED